MCRPVIVDVVTSVAVVGEEGTEIGLVSQFPDGIWLFAANSGYPTSTKLHRYAAKLLLPYSPSNSVRRLQYNHVIHSVLRQNFSCRYTWKCENI